MLDILHIPTGTVLHSDFIDHSSGITTRLFDSSVISCLFDSDISSIRYNSDSFAGVRRFIDKLEDTKIYDGLETYIEDVKLIREIFCKEEFEVLYE